MEREPAQSSGSLSQPSSTSNSRARFPFTVFSFISKKPPHLHGVHVCVLPLACPEDPTPRELPPRVPRPADVGLCLLDVWRQGLCCFKKSALIISSSSGLIHGDGRNACRFTSYMHNLFSILYSWNFSEAMGLRSQAGPSPRACAITRMKTYFFHTQHVHCLNSQTKGGTGGTHCKPCSCQSFPASGSLAAEEQSLAYP